MGKNKMTKGIEEVVSNNEVLAIVFRKNIPVSGSKFLTEESNPLQIGIQHRAKGAKLSAHVHKVISKLDIKLIQEVLIVQSGKIRVNLYDKENQLIARKILGEDDSILLLDAGHGVDFLEDSKVFLVKQGPFSNTIHSKLYLKDDPGK